MIKGHPQQMGVPFFVFGWWGLFGPVGSVWWGVCNTPLHARCPRRGRPQTPVCNTPLHVPGQIRRRPKTPLSALLSDSIFAAVFGDAKSDGPVRDVKRESSERLEQCPLL